MKGFWFTEVFTTHAKNEGNREVLNSLDASIEIGDSHINVLNKYWNLPEHGMRIYVNSPEEWSITMPREIAATNWIMVLRFADSRLSEVEIRNAEGSFPADAPQRNANHGRQATASPSPAT